MQIQRPLLRLLPRMLAHKLLWDDPTPPNMDQAGFRPNTQRGGGEWFGSKTLEEACRLLGIDMIVRGHQAKLNGVLRSSDGRLITIFTATNYTTNPVGNEGINCGLINVLYNKKAKFFC